MQKMSLFPVFSLVTRICERTLKYESRQECQCSKIWLHTILHDFKFPKLGLAKKLNIIDRFVDICIHTEKHMIDTIIAPPFGVTLFFSWSEMFGFSC